MSGKGLTSVPLLRDVTPASDSAVSLRWFFKVDVTESTVSTACEGGGGSGGAMRAGAREAGDW